MSIHTDHQNRLLPRLHCALLSALHEKATKKANVFSKLMC